MSEEKIRVEFRFVVRDADNNALPLFDVEYRGEVSRRLFRAFNTLGYTVKALVRLAERGLAVPKKVPEILVRARRSLANAIPVK